MRVPVVIIALLIADSAQAGSTIAGTALQGAASIGTAIIQPAPPKPGPKPEDSRITGDGIKTLRQPKQDDWDRWLRCKGYETGPRAEKME